MAKESYHNEAAGDARVGIMVGKVTGGVHQHNDSLRVERLQQQLAELRQALLDARQREELAPAVFAAAELELRTAERELPAAAEGDRGKLLSSLKRLRRHLDGTLGLAAQAATILAAVKGLT